MLIVDWIESGGGPLVVLPKSFKDNWVGVAGRDYAEACGVGAYLGVLAREWGEVLVLGDEPMSTAVIDREDGPCVIRWIYGPDEAQVIDVASSVNFGELKPVEEVAVRLQEGAYLIIDGAADGRHADALEFEPLRGAHAVVTYVVKDDSKEVALVLHRFRR